MPRRRSAGKIKRHSSVFDPTHPNRLAELIFGFDGKFFADGYGPMDEQELIASVRHWQAELQDGHGPQPRAVEVFMGMTIPKILQLHDNG